MRAISIQSNLLGNKVYNETLRHYAVNSQIHIDSFWGDEQRSLSTRLLAAAAHRSVPWLDADGRNMTLLRGRMEWSLGYMSARLLARRRRECDYDAVHFHTVAQAFGSTRAMRLLPGIVSIDGTVALDARRKLVRYPRTLWPGVHLERQAFRAARAIVSWSSWAAESVVRDHGIPASRVHVIAPGARLDDFRAPRIDRAERVQMLFVGGDFARKGGRLLLEAFRERLSDVADLHLVTNAAVGPLPANAYQHADVRPYSAAWHDRFQSADILALPSYEENYGLVLEEGGGYGLALIGSRVGAIPEIVRENETGLLCDPGDGLGLADALVRLVDDKDMLLAFRQASLETARERFNARKNFGQVFALIADVAKTG